MLTGDSNMLIRELLVGWAGSTHDARCWRNSGTKPFIERQLQYAVAGDSAYPISRHLMKPYLNPNHPKEVNFNKKLCGLRTVMTENIIGVWKNRFPILRLGIRTKVRAAEKIIYVTGMLHNMAMMLGDPEFEQMQVDFDDNDGEEAQEIHNHGQREAGRLHRNYLTQRYC